MGKAATGHAQAMGMAVLPQFLLLQRHALPLVSLGMEEHSLEIVSHVTFGEAYKSLGGSGVS